MKLVSYQEAVPRVGAVLDDPAAVHDILLDGEPWPSGLRELIEASDGDWRRITAASAVCAPLSQIRVTAPVPDASKIIAAPVNYIDHQAEMNEDAHIDSLGVFLKAPSSLAGDGGAVRLPYYDRRFDQEGELALIMGRTARNVTPEQALTSVFGYTCLLDITMRGGEDRSTRKSFDTFTPMGPWLVTPDEVGDLRTLRLTCSVNGQLRQDADVLDLIWGVPELIAYASSVMTLLPGDVITTGTPAGVGPLADGDQVSVSISRIGVLSVTVDSTGALPCPTRGAGRGPVPPAELTPLGGAAPRSRRPAASHHDRRTGLTPRCSPELARELGMVIPATWAGAEGAGTLPTAAGGGGFPARGGLVCRASAFCRLGLVPSPCAVQADGLSSPRRLVPGGATRR